MTDIDTRIFLVLHHALAGGWILMPMIVFSAVGGGWGAVSVVPLFASIRTRRFALSLAAVLATTAVLVFALKAIVGRARPCVSVQGVKALFFTAPTDYSFPSGHSAGSFAFAVFIAIVLVKTTPASLSRTNRALRFGGAGLLVLFAHGVALSRIALGVHFPGDVIAGAIIGATIAGVGARLHLRAQARGTTSLTS